MVKIDYYYFTIDNCETEEMPVWMMKDLWTSNRLYFKELRRNLRYFDSKEDLFLHNQEKLNEFYKKVLYILNLQHLDIVEKILKLRYEVYLLEHNQVLIHKLRLFTIQDWKNAIHKKYFTVFSTIEELESDIELLEKQMFKSKKRNMKFLDQPNNQCDGELIFIQ